MTPFLAHQSYINEEQLLTILILRNFIMNASNLRSDGLFLNIEKKCLSSHQKKLVTSQNFSFNYEYYLRQNKTFCSRCYKEHHVY